MFAYYLKAPHFFPDPEKRSSHWQNLAANFKENDFKESEADAQNLKNTKLP